MNKPLDPERAQILASGFVVDDLTVGESTEFQQLLNQHPSLVREVEDLQAVLHQVLDEFTDVEPPNHLLSTLLKVAESDKNCPVGARRSSVPWLKIATSLTVLLMVILGADYYRLRQNFSHVNAENQRLRQELEEARIVKALLQEPQTRILTFRAHPSIQDSSGRIILNAQRQKALMLVQNLQAPPPGQAYILWVVVANQKRFCGEIKPYVWGSSSYALSFTPEMYQDFYDPKFSGLVVTLESDPQVSHPTGPMVMQSSQS